MHIAKVPSRTTYRVTGAEKQALNTARKYVKQISFVIKSVSMELQELHGLKDQLFALNRDVPILAIKKFVAKESLDNEVFPENVRVLAKNYYKQKKNLLLINPKWVLCVKHPKNQRAFYARPCMIVMPQLYQQEILARFQESHTWPCILNTI